MKDLLVQAKDVSELMVDLAWASVIYDDRDIAREVIEIEDRMNQLVYELRRICLIASRSPEDADYFSSILQVASSMEKVGDAAEDIARVVLKRLGVPWELRRDLRHADEAVGRIPLGEGSALAGRSLEELAIPRETGVWLIAVRREVEWMFAPGPDFVLHEGDVLYAQGAESGLAALRRLVGADDEPEVPDWEPEDSLSVAVDLLVEMKNVTETAVGLAYSSLIFRDKGLAAEVAAIEDRTDQMYEDLESWVLAAGRTELDPSELRGLIHIGEATERIADAVQAMVWLIERDEELHPVLAEAFAEADEVVAAFTVVEDAPLANRSLGDLRVRTETGMDVLAIQRGNHWRYRPRKGFVLQSRDRILAIGPEDGVELLAALADPKVLQAAES
ncbi:MAG: potassium channel protein [Planctomycetaceae bacterium]|nr:potassium channel protein [Planctomycetaceae bacterium]